MTAERVGRPVLVVDDELDARNLLVKLIRKEGYDPVAVDRGEAALAALRERRFACILLDYNLPGKNGLEILSDIRAVDEDVQVIMVTSQGSIQLAVEAVKRGAHNFVEKPFNLDELRIAIRNAHERYELLRDNSRLRNLSNHSERAAPYVVGDGETMRRIWETVSKVAVSDTTVLIEGESGTGKEVIARAIHDRSLRKREAFVAQNCAALARDLIESELFGHVKGAFTGASETRKGRFEVADGGTLFLDEIGEISLDLQPKLLRVLQEGTFERVGDTSTRKADVRLVAATNRNLQTCVKEKTFREDLYYRLNVINIHLPPLRDRREDIPSFVDFFLGQIAAKQKIGAVTVSAAALEMLQSYSYPGNIRELRNILERGAILCSGGVIEARDLDPRMALKESGSAMVASKSLGVSGSETNFAQAKAAFERSHLMHLLTLTEGNVSQAARLAGMDRNNFKDKMRKYGIQSDDYREDEI